MTTAIENIFIFNKYKSLFFFSVDLIIANKNIMFDK